MDMGSKGGRGWGTDCKFTTYSINRFIKIMSDPHTLIDKEWLELNNIELNHKFLKVEFEVIYD